MKKYLFIMLALVLAASIAACSKNVNKKGTTEDDSIGGSDYSYTGIVTNDEKYPLVGDEEEPDSEKTTTKAASQEPANDSTTTTKKSGSNTTTTKKSGKSGTTKQTAQSTTANAETEATGFTTPIIPLN